jgi:predicted Ser/Thr protein kinase
MQIKKKLNFQIEISSKDVPELQILIKSIDDANSFCTKCNKIIGKKRELKHYNEVHLCKRISCPICGVKVKRLTPHLNLHFENNKQSQIFDFCLSSTNNNNNSPVFFNNFSFSSISNNIYDEIMKNYNKDLIKYNNNIYAFKSFIIGEGIHSKFLFGLNKNTKMPIGIKIYKTEEVKDFKKERTILNKLEKYNIFPKLLAFEENKKRNFICENLLGIDLMKLLKFENKNFDEITILNIAKDILVCLSYLNNEQIAHCDLKGDNLIWNIFEEKDESSKIILIDFSCAINLNKKTNYSKIGSNFYSSLNQNLKKIPNAKDEIESLIYTLLDLLNIDLPWLADDIKNKEMKKGIYVIEKTKFKIEEYLTLDIKILGLIFNDIKRKEKMKREDYDFYIGLLNDQIERLKSKLDLNYKFIWEPHIKDLLINAKKSNDYSIIDGKLFNNLFLGYPKEFILNILYKNFNIT